ncbi:hypothetical protein QFC21_003608 [Naganishia friedmannii]|uniref:Uncharacterized protein n=1 Tax=Naganishia friedmannii TaxID=89922 RepID=A0ACC2VNB5_9TREE|nr:hypothetical protein QFC21_003608 [Naganishia friedmannii]
MKVLCVAEKPSIAKSISGILSSGGATSCRLDSTSMQRVSPHRYIRNYDFPYNLPPPLGPNHGDADITVTSVLGHLTSSDFAEQYRKWDNESDTSYTTKDLKQVERNLQQEARRADMLIIWTDCDREGEHIGSEIVNVCRQANRNIRVKRAKFSAIIAAQIHNACRNPVELDMRQADAVDVRISLDLRVGAAFTRLQTMGLQNRLPDLGQKVISYGPCQFPTLGFVVDQYERVQAFVPETFWYIYVEQQRPEGVIKFNWRRNHLFDMAAAIILYEQCVEQPEATVRSVVTKPATKWKPLPLTTVDLQKSGSRLLHMAPKKVLDIAEKLYQQGFLSYPRTETDQFDKDFDFNHLIQKQHVDPGWGAFAQGLTDGGFQRPRNGQKNDKAHPPIHPTAHAGTLQGDEKRVYEFVTRRFLACCSTNAEGKSTTVEIDIAGEYFSTAGLVIIARNYLEVYPYDKWSDSIVPDFAQGETFIPAVCEMREGQTSRPNLLTEADLVGLMDKNGIGTDATIAEHIAKIVEREYVVEKLDGRTKYLVPSTLGIGLVDGYNQIGFDRSLTKPHLRRETEHRMQLICDGLESKRDVLEASLTQYREVFIKAKRDFETLYNSVARSMGGRGIQAGDVARRPPPPGGRGNGGNGGNNDDDDGPPSDGGGDERPPGAPAPRANGKGKAGGKPTTAKATKTKAATAKTATAKKATKAKGKASAVEEPASHRVPNGSGGGPSSGSAMLQANGSAGASASTGAAMLCKCGDAAVHRTVVKEGANKGKGFWACAKAMTDATNCKFFITNRPTQRAKTSHDTDEANGPKRFCTCKQEALRWTVHKEGPNCGRAFYKCPKPQGEQCEFFEWEDEPKSESPAARRAPPPAKAGEGRFSGHSQGKPGAGDSKCYKCGRSGHWATNCDYANKVEERGKPSYIKSTSRRRRC